MLGIEGELMGKGIFKKLKRENMFKKFSLSSEKPQKDLKGVTHVVCVLEKQLLKRL